MPISRQQCSKYIRLATEKPDLLSNGKHDYHLDINSELKLLSLDDDTAEEVRDFAEEHELTRQANKTLDPNKPHAYPKITARLEQI